jgi:hypothetical protein
VLAEIGAAPEGSTEPSIAAPKSAAATARFMIWWFIVVSSRIWSIKRQVARVPLAGLVVTTIAVQSNLVADKEPQEPEGRGALESRSWRGGSEVSWF